MRKPAKVHLPSKLAFIRRLVLSVKVKTKISTIANAGDFSKEELLVESHDLINSDAVD